MDRPFDRPLILGNGQRTRTITSPQEAGAFLLQEWPCKRRSKSYRVAIQACVKALGGKVEPEVARQALIEALEDLAGKPSR